MRAIYGRAARSGTKLRSIAVWSSQTLYPLETVKTRWPAVMWKVLDVDGVSFAELANLVSQVGMLPLVLYFIWQGNAERKECQAAMARERSERHAEYRDLSAKWNEVNMKQIELNSVRLADNSATLLRLIDCIDDLKGKG